MNTLLLPTSYMPPLNYVALLLKSSCAIIEIHETFPKQTHRNRCEILTSNGIMRLSVPVVRTNGNHTLTQDITVSYAERWNIQHIRAIESAYNTAPYFLYLWDPLKAILLERHERLIDLNTKLMDYLLSKLSIECQLNYSEEYLSGQQTADSTQPLDLRDMFAHNKGINPIEQPSNPSPINLSTNSAIKSEQSESLLSFSHRSRMTPNGDNQRINNSAYQNPYYQIWADRHGFCPNLSIIDLLFNLGPAESRNYLKALAIH